MHMMRLMIDRCLQRPQSSKQSKRPEDHWEAAPGPPTGMPVTGAAAAGSLGLDGYMSSSRLLRSLRSHDSASDLSTPRFLGSSTSCCSSVCLSAVAFGLFACCARSLPGMSEPGCCYIYYELLPDRPGKWAAGPIPIRVATWRTGPTNRTSGLVDRPL
jgi:hypothetical protein